MNKIPPVGYGIGTAWYKARPGDLDRTLIEAIKSALAAGFRHFDNAEVYGNEAECGVAFREYGLLHMNDDGDDGKKGGEEEKKGGGGGGGGGGKGLSRDEVWVTTKLKTSTTRERTPVESLRGSLARLGLARVDLYLIHSPFGYESELPAIWRDMEACVDAGLTRFIGVSNFRAGDVEAVLAGARLPVHLNQVECHPYCTRPADLDRVMAEHDILGSSYAPLAPLVHRPDGPLTGTVRTLAKKYGRTEGQVLLRWNLQKGNIVITTTSKTERMKEQLDITSWELADGDVHEIDAVGAQLHYRKYFPKQMDGDEG